MNKYQREHWIRSNLDFSWEEVPRWHWDKLILPHRDNRKRLSFFVFFVNNGVSPGMVHRWAILTHIRDDDIAITPQERAHYKQLFELASKGYMSSFPYYDVNIGHVIYGNQKSERKRKDRFEEQRNAAISRQFEARAAEHKLWEMEWEYSRRQTEKSMAEERKRLAREDAEYQRLEHAWRTRQILREYEREENSASYLDDEDVRLLAEMQAFEDAYELRMRKKRPGRAFAMDAIKRRKDEENERRRQIVNAEYDDYPDLEDYADYEM